MHFFIISPFSFCAKNNPDQRSLNATCVHDPFPTPFTDDVLENVGGQETY